MGSRFTKEGNGWRLGWDAAAPHYQGLLAGPAWAVELTQVEFLTFQRLVVEISEAMDAIAAELMDTERITCEAEADCLWLEAEGFPDAYSLRFILTTGRRCQGEWDAEATQKIIRVIAHETGF
ncbi:MAG: DUF1818 family protein [Cyanobacteria bacterium J06638_6]